MSLTGSYQLKMYFNGSVSAGLTINLSGTLASGDVYVVAHSLADAAILAQADQTTGSGLYNGDDALELVKAGVVVDSFGQVGVDPGTEWPGGGLDDTLRRDPSICGGDTISTDAFDAALQWDSFAVNSFGDLGVHSVSCGGGDLPPQLLGTDPDAGEAEVALDAAIELQFSEPVDVAPGAVTLSCAVSGVHSVSVSAGSATVSVDPDVDFASLESCSLQIPAASVVDLDGTPDALASDVSLTFTTREVSICGAPATAIHAVQGAGAASPLVAEIVTIEGVVVGDFQGSAGLNGFFVQDEAEDSDADAATSEGIFVFDADLGVNVNLGDVVRVRGTVTEYFNLTELTNITEVQVCATGSSVTPTAVALPSATTTALEAVEGMLVRFAQTLFVSETYNQGRYGEVLLSAGDRLRTPTQVAAPGAAALAVQQANALASIQLDDGSNVQNPATPPYLGVDDTLRIGDTVAALTGVLGFGFGTFEVHPTLPVDIARSNPREEFPAERSGSVRVASFNVLNYFTTLDTGSAICGPSGGLDCRGANTATELERQRTKIVAALSRMDADVVGLLELQNDASAAIADLVAGVNAELGAEVYDYIDTGTIGTDAIKVALIFNTERVAPLGVYAVLDSSVDPQFIDTRNRPVLAQTFEELASGEVFTVAVNHLKSKGSACAGDPDLGDGQGNCNQTRLDAVEAEVAWLATDPTDSGDPDMLLIGDFNAYAQEEPVAAVVDAGYSNLLDEFIGPNAYSYVFEGQSGALDHAFASASLAPQVTGATEWHINADEPRMLDYNTEFNPPALYSPGPFKASDHDPLLIDLELYTPPPAPTCGGFTATIYVDAEGLIVGGPNAGQRFAGVLRGTSSSDVIVGSAGHDLIAGLGGDDVACGLEGTDIMIGAGGIDRFFGGPGIDLLQGAGAADILDGGADSDIIEGAAGADTLIGGDGADVIDGAAGADQLFGGSGNDILRGGAGVDHCDGGTNNDVALTCETTSAVP